VSTTRELIDEMTRDLGAAPRRMVERRLAIGGGAGLLVSFAAMVVWLGVRPDLQEAIGTVWFWLKFAYTFLLGCCLAGAVMQLSRPGSPATRPVVWALLVFATIASLAMAQLAWTDSASSISLVVGNSASKCPWIIIFLSLPILGGLVWAVQGLAPTRLAATGFAIGLMSGAVAAFIYSFHCDETAVPFLAIWYTLGIVAAGLIGAVVGSSALRW
jgi:hypothetical protein